MGRVYSRKRSPYLWIKYYQHGRPVRESTGTKNEVVARRMRRARKGDVERGIPIDPKVGLVTLHEAAEDMLNDYKPNRKRTNVDAERRINKHLAPCEQAVVVDHRERYPRVHCEADGRTYLAVQRGESDTATARCRNCQKSGGLSPLARSTAS
jgi:hypothetical protein